MKFTCASFANKNQPAIFKVGSWYMPGCHSYIYSWSMRKMGQRPYVCSAVNRMENNCHIVSYILFTNRFFKHIL